MQTVAGARALEEVERVQRLPLPAPFRLFVASPTLCLNSAVPSVTRPLGAL